PSHAEATHEIGILQQWQRPRSADLVVLAASDEQSLLAVRRWQRRAAQTHRAFNQARRKAIVVEREAEGSGGMARGAAVEALHEVRRLALPARLEHGVRVQEQQPRMPGSVG